MKTITQSTLQTAYEALRARRTWFFENCSIKESTTQVQELNKACQELLRAMYPVVTMKDIANKVETNPKAQVSIQYSATSCDLINKITRVTPEEVGFEYNDQQRTAHNPDREFYVTHNKGNFVTVVPVEFWSNNIY